MFQQRTEQPASERLAFVRPNNPANGVQSAKQLVATLHSSPSSNGSHGGGGLSQAMNGGAASIGLASASTKTLRYQPLPAPTGLINSGTSCFFNASIQCLLACPVFVHFLLNLQSIVPSKVNVTDVLDMLASHVTVLSSNAKRKFLDVTPVLRSVRKASQGAIRMNRQEDSHEALCVLFDMMEKACLTRMGLPTSMRVDTTSESTMIHTMFAGSNTTTTTCPSCKNRSSKTESFLQLSLELDANKTSSIPQLLKKMSQVEKLDAKNLWECEKCKKKVMAERKTSVSKAPPVLIVHLKRFGFSFLGGSMKRTKLKTPIIIGTEDLTVEDMTNKQFDYSLVAVLVHRGATLNSGHYFSYIKCAASGMWYEADDEMISRVKTTQVLGEREAYMLFYSRKDTLRSLPPSSSIASTPATSPSAIPSSIPCFQNGHSPAPKVVVKQDSNTGKVTAANGGTDIVSDSSADETESEGALDLDDDFEDNRTRRSLTSPRTSFRKIFDPRLQNRLGRRRSIAGLVPRMIQKLRLLRWREYDQKADRIALAPRGNGIQRPAGFETSPSKIQSPAFTVSSSKKARMDDQAHTNGSNLCQTEKPLSLGNTNGASTVRSPTMTNVETSVVQLKSAVSLPQRSQGESNGTGHLPRASTVVDDLPFSFDIKPIKKKVFDDAWDAHLDKGKVKKVKSRF